MPPRTKTQEEIEQIRRKILDSALNITVQKGYDALSMRKIASYIGMSATNIYNYFHNKDEVYLAILTEGYELIYQETNEGLSLKQNAKERLEHVIKAYVNFGLKKAYYYEIMFSSHMPKYLDYVGLPHEQIAYNKKVTAIKWFECFKKCVAECMPEHFENRDPMIVSLRIIGQLHGVLNLYHNKVLVEVYDNPLDVIDETVKYVMKEMGL